jgi:hypothetical protein
MGGRRRAASVPYTSRGSEGTDVVSLLTRSAHFLRATSDRRFRESQKSAAEGSRLNDPDASVFATCVLDVGPKGCGRLRHQTWVNPRFRLPRRCRLQYSGISHSRAYSRQARRSGRDERPVTR